MSGIIIDVAADSSAARRDLQQINSSLQSIQKSTKSTTDALSGMVSKLAAIATAGLSVAYLSKASDEFTNLSNKIALATSSSKGLVEIQKQVVDIARSTRSELASVTQTFQGMSVASKRTGATMETMLKATKAVQQSIAISGGTLESSRAATVQLNQALASGVLRGEEFNSINEQSPRIIQAIADNLRMTTGEMKGLADAGKLTSNLVFAALIKQSDTINKEFAKLKPTIQQSVGSASLALKVLVNEFNTLTGASVATATAIMGMATAINDAADNMAKIPKSLSEMRAFLDPVITSLSSIGQVIAVSLGKATSRSAQFGQYLSFIPDFLERANYELVNLTNSWLLLAGKSQSFIFGGDFRKFGRTIASVNSEVTQLTYSLSKTLAFDINDRALYELEQQWIKTKLAIVGGEPLSFAEALNQALAAATPNKLQQGVSKFAANFSGLVSETISESAGLSVQRGINNMFDFGAAIRHVTDAADAFKDNFVNQNIFLAMAGGLAAVAKVAIRLASLLDEVVIVALSFGSVISAVFNKLRDIPPIDFLAHIDLSRGVSKVADALLSLSGVFNQLASDIESSSGAVGKTFEAFVRHAREGMRGINDVLTSWSRFVNNKGFMGSMGDSLGILVYDLMDIEKTTDTLEYQFRSMLLSAAGSGGLASVIAAYIGNSSGVLGVAKKVFGIVAGLGHGVVSVFEAITIRVKKVLEQLPTLVSDFTAGFRDDVGFTSLIARIFSADTRIGIPLGKAARVLVLGFYNALAAALSGEWGTASKALKKLGVDFGIELGMIAQGIMAALEGSLLDKLLKSRLLSGIGMLFRKSTAKLPEVLRELARNLWRNKDIDGFGKAVTSIFGGISIAIVAMLAHVYKGMKAIAKESLGIMSSFGVDISPVYRFVAAVENALKWLGKLWESIQNSSVLEKSISGLSNFATRVIHIFKTIWDAVVGHSWWTDTINTVISTSESLWDKVKQPLSKFGSKVKSVFSSVYNVSDADLRSGVAAIFAAFKGVAEAVPSVLKAVFAGGGFLLISKMFEAGAVKTTLMTLFGVPFLISALTLSEEFGKTLFGTSLAAQAGKGAGLAISGMTTTLAIELPRVASMLVNFISSAFNTLASNLPIIGGISKMVLDVASMAKVDKAVGLIGGILFGVGTLSVMSTLGIFRKQIQGIFSAFAVLTGRGKNGQGLIASALFGNIGVARVYAGLGLVLTAMGAFSSLLENPVLAGLTTGGLLYTTLFGSSGFGAIKKGAIAVADTLISALVGALGISGTRWYSAIFGAGSVAAASGVITTFAKDVGSWMVAGISGYMTTATSAVEMFLFGTKGSKKSLRDFIRNLKEDIDSLKDWLSSKSKGTLFEKLFSTGPGLGSKIKENVSSFSDKVYAYYDANIRRRSDKGASPMASTFANASFTRDTLSLVPREGEAAFLPLVAGIRSVDVAATAVKSKFEATSGILGSILGGKWMKWLIAGGVLALFATLATAADEQTQAVTGLSAAWSDFSTTVSMFADEFPVILSTLLAFPAALLAATAAMTKGLWGKKHRQKVDLSNLTDKEVIKKYLMLPEPTDPSKKTAVAIRRANRVKPYYTGHTYPADIKRQYKMLPPPVQPPADPRTMYSYTPAPLQLPDQKANLPATKGGNALSGVGAVPPTYKYKPQAQIGKEAQILLPGAPLLLEDKSGEERARKGAARHKAYRDALAAEMEILEKVHPKVDAVGASSESLLKRISQGIAGSLGKVTVMLTALVALGVSFQMATSQSDNFWSTMALGFMGVVSFAVTFSKILLTMWKGQGGVFGNIAKGIEAMGIGAVKYGNSLGTAAIKTAKITSLTLLAVGAVAGLTAATGSIAEGIAGAVGGIALLAPLISSALSSTMMAPVVAWFTAGFGAILTAGVLVFVGAGIAALWFWGDGGEGGFLSRLNNGLLKAKLAIKEKLGITTKEEKKFEGNAAGLQYSNMVDPANAKFIQKRMGGKLPEWEKINPNVFDKQFVKAIEEQSSALNTSVAAAMDKVHLGQNADAELKKAAADLLSYNSLVEDAVSKSAVNITKAYDGFGKTLRASRLSFEEMASERVSNALGNAAIGITSVGAKFADFDPNADTPEIGRKRWEDKANTIRHNKKTTYLQGAIPESAMIMAQLGTLQKDLEGLSEIPTALAEPLKKAWHAWDVATKQMQEAASKEALGGFEQDVTARDASIEKWKDVSIVVRQAGEAVLDYERKQKQIDEDNTALRDLESAWSKAGQSIKISELALSDFDKQALLSSSGGSKSLAAQLAELNKEFEAGLAGGNGGNTADVAARRQELIDTMIPIFTAAEANSLKGKFKVAFDGMKIKPGELLDENAAYASLSSEMVNLASKINRAQLDTSLLSELFPSDMDAAQVGILSKFAGVRAAALADLFKQKITTQLNLQPLENPLIQQQQISKDSGIDVSGANLYGLSKQQKAQRTGLAEYKANLANLTSSAATTGYLDPQAYAALTRGSEGKKITKLVEGIPMSGLGASPGKLAKESLLQLQDMAAAADYANSRIEVIRTTFSEIFGVISGGGVTVDAWLSMKHETKATLKQAVADIQAADRLMSKGNLSDKASEAALESKQSAEKVIKDIGDATAFTTLADKIANIQQLTQGITVAEIFKLPPELLGEYDSLLAKQKQFDKLKSKTSVLSPAEKLELEALNMELEAGKKKHARNTYGAMDSALSSRDFEVTGMSDSSKASLGNFAIQLDQLKKDIADSSDSIDVAPLQSKLKLMETQMQHMVLGASKGVDLMVNSSKASGISVDKAAYVLLDKTQKDLIDSLLAQAVVLKGNQVINPNDVQAAVGLDSISKQIADIVAKGSFASRANAAGASFSESVTSAFTSGLTEVVKGKKSSKDFITELADTFTSGILDAFMKGLMDPFTGKNGIIDQMLQEMGAMAFGLPQGPAKSAGDSGGGAAKQLFGGLAGLFTGKKKDAGNGVAAAKIDSETKINGWSEETTTALESSTQQTVTAIDTASVKSSIDFSKMAVGFEDGLTEMGGLINSSFLNIKKMNNFGIDIPAGASVDWLRFAVGAVGKFMGAGGSTDATVATDNADYGGIASAAGVPSTSMNSGGTYSSSGSTSSGYNLGSGVLDVNVVDFNVSKYAGGGKITGPGSGISDSIPAMLSNGEFVVRAKQAAKFGPLLQAINGGTVSAYATGGSVGADIGNTVVVKSAEKRNVEMGFVAGAQKNTSVFNINVTGDISRQTKSEIQRMIPQIAAGVGKHNYERR